MRCRTCVDQCWQVRVEDISGKTCREKLIKQTGLLRIRLVCSDILQPSIANCFLSLGFKD